MLVYPPSIASILGTSAYQPEAIGKSGAQVLVFDGYVLKIRPADSPDTRDVQVLRWLSGKLPVPEVAAHAVADGQDWLLMTRMPGRMLCDPQVMGKPTLLLDCMAQALHSLWRIPISECPFEHPPEARLSRAESIILSGGFDPSDCEPETFGPGGFESPLALLTWLKAHQPPLDRVMTHGDFCLPNLFAQNGRFRGFIDVGGAGIADRWADLALGWRSLKHNSDGHYGPVYPAIDPDDLFRAVGIAKDEEKLRYYILLDELP